ncbi:formyl-CoA transferase [Bradyrhizobium sp. LMTR 3]|nr:formyl-CoA transferase [Bradyrhizobium sp. LMTR 3]
MREVSVAEALQGIVVLDLTAYLAGPYGCALLGDVGADVIKIEPPAGDNTRNYPSSLDEENRTFLGANRNKRSIVLNLKHSDGLAAFYRLVEKADVVVHNFRPAVPARLGIDYETLRRRRPDLIYCSFTGYGENENGPLRDHPGFDTMLQCFTGIAAMQGVFTGGQPQVMTGSIVDYYSASIVTIAILSALVHRLRTGEGQHVRASLLRSAISLQAGNFIWAEGEPRDIQRFWGQSYSGIYPAKDGHLYLQATTQSFWKNLCEYLGFPELADDPRYDTLVKRNVLRHEIRPLIRDALVQRTALEWEQLLLGKVPCVAVRSMEDMFDHPQVVAEGIVVEHEHPRVGKYKAMGKAVQMGVGDKLTTRAPMLGEHTEEVLAQFGFADDELAAMRANGAAA